MNIENNAIPEVKGTDPVQHNNETRPSEVKEAPVQPPETATENNPISQEEARLAIDKATQLLQTIVTDKISEEVIRKIPADEYLNLLSRLDDMISGSLDDQA